MENNKLYQWKKFITTYMDNNALPQVKVEVTTKSRKEISKERTGVTILSILETESLKTAGKCQNCGKPFAIGDKVVCMNFHEYEIVFLDGHLAYFSYIYPGEDSLDSRKQLRYIVHSCHISLDQINQYREGQQLWKEGMRICGEVKTKCFKW